VFQDNRHSISNLRLKRHLARQFYVRQESETQTQISLNPDFLSLRFVSYNFYLASQSNDCQQQFMTDKIRFFDRMDSRQEVQSKIKLGHNIPNFECVCLYQTPPLV